MSSTLAELKLDIEELEKLAALSKRKRVSDLLSLELRRIDTEIVKLREELDKKNVTPSKPVVNTTKCYDVKLSTYAWDQSDKFVKIFVTLKNVQSVGEDKVVCKFDPKNFELTVKELENRNYTLTIKDLLHEIDTAKSYWKVKTDLVVIFLAKKKVSEKWSYLSSTEHKAKEPKKPTSDKSDGSNDMMDLMRKMYEEGDDEMKRTIAKCWTESREKQTTMEF